MRIRNILLSAVIAVGCLFGMTGCSEVEGNVGEVTLKSGDLIAEIDIESYGTIYAKLFPDAAPVGVENFQKLADEGYYDGLTIHRVVADFMFQGGSLNGDGTGGDALVNGGSFGIETNENVRHFYGALCYANAMGSNTTQFYIVNNSTSQDLSSYDKETFEYYAEYYDALAESYADVDDANAYYSFQADYYRTMAEWITGASDEVVRKYADVGGTPTLDGNYTVFGQVYDGFDVIESISAVEVMDNGNSEVSKPIQEITISSVKVYEYSTEE